ncbi:unnamed protein product (macronuclear) [Paramecium tetraurelia]|uniref:Kinase domain protein n=1 Tax=Paramecium tetraurelia TaxID=5888 RepID=A0BAV3_PARTE|nr:uncharacterized protein GSPATT00000105001 [Paramecium tetraurelia]CAK55670.1 unnamed protein product [Paramecium tetraurelia]|eukprot:XP_001423068.1 hypothetical protein (macronuclear) [Paramecium tetraurelia strain d4-2]
MSKNQDFEQVCQDICIYHESVEHKMKPIQKPISKLNLKKDKLMKKFASQIIRSEQRIKSPFQIEIFQQQKRLNDKCVETMSSELVLSKPQKNLSIDLSKKWHLDLSDLTDKGVRDLSEGLSKLQSLEQLNLTLCGWGYWNQNITDKSLQYITNALILQNQLHEFNLDLNMWAYENNSITDEGAKNLMNGISGLSNLGKLELNLKGWGDGNQDITDNTVLGLSTCLKKLGNLSEVKLVLWQNIGKQAIKQLNKTLSKMENLTKIDVKFESCAQQQPVQNNNTDLKLQQIKVNAVYKRRLLFQVEGIMINLESLINKRTLWDIILKL